jgi:hypothetical protein
MLTWDHWEFQLGKVTWHDSQELDHDFVQRVKESPSWGKMAGISRCGVGLCGFIGNRTSVVSASGYSGAADRHYTSCIVKKLGMSLPPRMHRDLHHGPGPPRWHHHHQSLCLSLMVDTCSIFYSWWIRESRLCRRYCLKVFVYSIISNGEHQNQDSSKIVCFIPSWGA